MSTPRRKTKAMVTRMTMETPTMVATVSVGTSSVMTDIDTLGSIVASWKSENTITNDDLIKYLV